MQVSQIYSIVNDVTTELIGTSAVLEEDLSNIVDVGTAVFDNTTTDNYVRALLNRIGKVVFVDRPYRGKVPSVLMDSWDYGSVLEKIEISTPAATANDTWQLTNGQTYNQDIFYKPTATVKFYDSKVTFEVPISIAERQVKESFGSARELNSFITAIYNAVEKSMTIKINSLVMRTINNMVGETLTDCFTSADTTGYTVFSGMTSLKAVNLLYGYNQQFSENLTVNDALTTPEFIRYASYQIGLYADRLAEISTLFNIGGKERFTPKDSLRIIMLSDFKESANVYLNSDTFHDNYVALPNSESVPYWQGSGTSYDFSSISAVHIDTASAGTEVTFGGLLCVMFDKNGVAVCNTDRRVTTNYNAKAEFYNNWFKFDASYMNDTNENFVLFYIA